MHTSACDFSFNMEELAIGVTASLKEALEHEMIEIMDEYGYGTRLGYGQFRWNPIIKYLQGMCDHLGWVEFGKLRRGAWKVPVLFYPGRNVLLTLMTEGTFKDLQRKKKNEHYLYSCASFNSDIDAEQICLDLPNTPADHEKWVVQTREQLADAVHAEVGDISGHILILFDVADDTVVSVRAIRLTPELAISKEEEDWSRYIKVPYDAGQRVEPQQNDEPDEEMFVTL